MRISLKNECSIVIPLAGREGSNLTPVEQPERWRSLTVTCPSTWSVEQVEGDTAVRGICSSGRGSDASPKAPILAGPVTLSVSGSSSHVEFLAKRSEAPPVRGCRDARRSVSHAAAGVSPLSASLPVAETYQVGPLGGPPSNAISSQKKDRTLHIHTFPV